MREDSNAGFSRAPGSRALVKKWWRETDVRSSAIYSHPPPASSRWSFFGRISSACMLRTLVLVELVAPWALGLTHLPQCSRSQQDVITATVMCSEMMWVPRRLTVLSESRPQLVFVEQRGSFFFPVGLESWRD